MSYAGHSNVGFPSIYESQNQRNCKQSEVEELRRTTGENVKAFRPRKHTGDGGTAKEVGDRNADTCLTMATEDQQGEVDRLVEHEVSRYPLCHRP